MQIQLTQQNNDLRRQAEQVNVEQMELRRQFQREKETILKQFDDEKLLNTKLTKSNQKFSNDIADVTILKGAGSAALYGSEASNGAILITTKEQSSC